MWDGNIMILATFYPFIGISLNGNDLLLPPMEKLVIIRI
jgi:hypothetical protein